MLKPFIATVLFSITVGVQANQEEMFDIAPFLPFSYTQGFTKEVEWTIDMKMGDPSLSVEMDARLIIGQSRGKPINKFDKNWIGVLAAGKTVIDDEIVDVRALDLYAPESKMQVYSINLIDESVTYYEWGQMPTRMRSGELRTVGKITERSKAGELLSSGEIRYAFKKKDTGYELCYIEKTVQIESKSTQVARMCDVFDNTKKPTDIHFEIRDSLGMSGKGSGPVRFR